MGYRRARITHDFSRASVVGNNCTVFLIIIRATRSHSPWMSYFTKATSFRQPDNRWSLILLLFVTEAFLHYVWQFQYFDKSGLATLTGDTVSVFSAGYRNTHSGPDFFQARIRLGDIEWIGSVEIHIFSSGWLDHGHSRDRAYDGVILHVVWKNDREILRPDGSIIPTLEIGSRINSGLVLQYARLMRNPETVPCSGLLPRVSDVIRYSMLDRALAERLESKSGVILKRLARNNHDWEETAYQTIMRNFGFMVNGDPFLQLAQALPYRLLMRHADKSGQVEALLFGQAGFLQEDVPGDPYYSMLRREYRMLASKYKLAEGRLNRAQWRFLRLRPANFPTLRLAQAAALLYRNKNFFSCLTECRSAAAIRALFQVTQSAYWLSHYHFFKPQKNQVSLLGAGSIDNMVINSAIPLVVAYGKSRNDDTYIERAVAILQQLDPETNMITRHWKDLGFRLQHAFDSQAIVQLNNTYCQRRKCLDCKIGASLVNPSST